MKQLILIFAMAFFLNAFADDSTIYIDIGKAKVKQSLLALPPLQYAGTQTTNPRHISAGQDLFTVINNDLAVSGLFTMIQPGAYLEDPMKVGLKPAPGEPGGFHYDKWRTIGTDFLIRGSYNLSENDLNMDVYVYHVPGSKMIMAKSYHASAEAFRRIAHTFSNDLIKSLTGNPGMFLTRLVASKQENPTAKTSYKEIYIMDWDGANQQPITASKTISLSPTWSNSGTKIAYTSYAFHVKSGLRNPDMFIYDIETNKRFLISYRKGVNSGANFMPGDKSLLLTLTNEGNPDIYKMSADGEQITALTHGPNRALNVEPAISPDGRTIAFSSDRSGRPMIWTMDTEGKNLKRLTWAGTYNSTPAWSPDGKTLAIAILDSSHFDIFTINADGTGLKRLTDAKKASGRPANNESPTWSPDGTHIAFVSDRTGPKQVYVINADGTNERRITHDAFTWDRPKWSPFLK